MVGWHRTNPTTNQPPPNHRPNATHRLHHHLPVEGFEVSRGADDAVGDAVPVFCANHKGLELELGELKLQLGLADAKGARRRWGGWGGGLGSKGDAKAISGRCEWSANG